MVAWPARPAPYCRRQPDDFANPRLHPCPRRAPEQPARARPRHPAAPAGRGHRRVRLRQVLAGVRHGLRRGPAPLRRDVLAVRAPVPRPHGQAAGRPHRGHPAGDRHRPDQPGAHLALDGRDDDRAERPPEAALRAGGPPALPRLRAASASRHAREHRRGTPRARGGRRRSAAGADLPGGSAEELHRGGSAGPARAAGLHAGARTCAGAARDRAGPLPRGLRWIAADCSRRSRPRCGSGADGSMCRSSNRLPRRRARVCGASPPTCTAPTATSTTAIRRRACSRSIPRSAPARPAAASAASSASTTGSSCRTRRRRCAAARSAPGRPSRTASARRTW